MNLQDGVVAGSKFCDSPLYREVFPLSQAEGVRGERRSVDATYGLKALSAETTRTAPLSSGAVVV